jgi:peptidoglycan/xylan/chitin deacetylase (PgdA/CDA1 family)
MVGARYLQSRLHNFGIEDSELTRVFYIIESNASCKLISHVDTGGEKLVALTFDDGPDPRFTPQVLDILDYYHVKATFFIVGQQARKNPELVRRISREGYEIENHTYSHPDLSKYSIEQTRNEIIAAQRIITDLTNRRPRCFRPPKKLFRPETIEVAEKYGYKTILWTICVENNKCKTPGDMASRVIKAARPGMIILAHDGRLDRSKTVESLPFIIEGYLENGYRFVTMDELFQAEKQQI